jgi:hypothetical protein
VVIVGTTMGATSDLNGRYFILNVPPGVYQIKASIIGYEAVTVSPAGCDDFPRLPVESNRR